MAGLYEIEAYFTGYLNNHNAPQTVAYALKLNNTAIETATRRMEHNFEDGHMMLRLYARADLAGGNNTISVGNFTNGLTVDNTDRLTIVIKPLVSSSEAMAVIDTTTGLATMAVKVIDTTMGGFYTHTGGYWIIETI